MRRAGLTVGALLLAMVAGATTGRGALILNTLPASPVDDPLVGTTGDLNTGRIKGIAFTMGADAYTLDSVVLRLQPNFNGNGPTQPVVQILADAGSLDAPGTTVLATLTTPAALPGGISNTTFTPTGGLTLMGGQRYWLVVSGATSAFPSGLSWFGRPASELTPTGVATVSSIRFLNTAVGPNWGPSTSLNYFTINGTLQPIPEPSSLAMVALGTVALAGGAWRARARRRV